MRFSSLLNALVLVLLAVTTYLLTLHLDSNNSRVIQQPEAPIETMAQDRPAPVFSFTTPDGKSHTISDFEGKTIILNFWASWCAPCIKEFPHFLKAAQEMKDDVVLIAISSDLDEASMQKFIDKLAQNSKTSIKQDNVFIALDSDQSITKDLFQIYRLPETILIDPKLNMRSKIIGADWDYSYLLNQIEDLRNNDS